MKPEPVTQFSVASSGFTPSRWLIVIALVLAVAIPSGVWAYHRVMWQTPDGQAIGTTVDGAIYAYHAFDLPPAKYRGGRVPKTVIRQLRARAYALARRYYTGAQLKEWLGIYRRDISEGTYASPYFFGCHVVSEHRDQISWLITSADATAGEVVQCTNGLRASYEDSFHLLRTSSGWRIDSWGGQCLSGCP